MIEKKLTLSYQEGSDYTTLPDTHQRLILAAIEASKSAYAPYSGFHVGAALLTDTGTIITGNNQENAAYPMCNCAEQVTLQKALSSDPKTKPTLFAVYAQSKDAASLAAPCGACRQVLSEVADRCGQDFPVILAARNGAYRILNVRQLLPFYFSGSDLL